MTGRLSFRSQTTEEPLDEVDAMMCWTFLFHPTHVTSELCAGLAPGLYTVGACGLVMSQIKICEQRVDMTKRRAERNKEIQPQNLLNRSPLSLAGMR